jgi:ATP-dependent DNA helicase RecQ
MNIIGATYEDYRINFLVPEEEIVAGFDEERGKLLSDLFAQGKRGKKWVSIDPGKAADAMGSTRERIVKALDYLGEKSMVELGVRGVMNRYRRLRLPEDRAALTAELYRHALDREAREIGRLQQVLELTQNDGCQAEALSAHFGETLDSSCGHCSWCIGGGEKTVLPERTHPAVEEALWGRALAVREEHEEILSSPRVFTRWLCGVTSPALTRSKLSRDSLFGAFSNVPFQVVMEKSME